MKTTLLAISLAAFFSLQAQDLPPGKGKELLENNCSECHGPDSVMALHQSRAAWKDLVDDMVGKGAQVTPEQIATIVDYLATNFGPPVNVNKSAAKDIADNLGLTAAEADLIVKYRTDHGNFKNMDDLYKAGVDRAKLNTKKAQITF